MKATRKRDHPRSLRFRAAGFRRVGIAALLCSAVTAQLPALSQTEEAEEQGRKTEFLPILSYDTDAGLGYGLKLFGLDHLGANESFDLVLFHSTKGERWYRLVSSFPDLERRQGTVYGLAVDLIVDYDRWNSRKFYGVGNASPTQDEETYTRTAFDLTMLASRGFSESFVGTVGIRYQNIANSNFEAGSSLEQLPPAGNAGTATSLAARVSVRFDNRDSYINPSQGIVLQGELDYAPQLSGTSVGYVRWSVLMQAAQNIIRRDVVIAGRFWLQEVAGDELPVQLLLPVGGTNTVRGLVQDRYLDHVAAVGNLEIRFPIVWRFGGIVGFDAGKVWHAVSDMDLLRWPVNPVVGLRFYMDTFVVRLDAGFGKETTGFYLNFGHLF